MKQLLIAAASLATIAAPIAASAQPAWGGHDNRGGYSQGYDRGGYDRGYRGGYDRGDRGGDAGAAFAAGLFGLFLGAALTSSHHGYDYPPPYQVRCHWETQAYEGPWGQVDYQQVQVCR